MKQFTEFFKENYLIYESENFINKLLLIQIISEAVDEIETTADGERKYLDNAEEVALIKIYQGDPDSPEGRAALEKIVKYKTGLIVNLVDKHLITHPYKMSYRKDLIQEGLLALLKLIDKFDVNSGNIFNKYVKDSIRGILLNVENPVRSKSVMQGKADKNGNLTSMISVDTPVSGSRGEWGDKDTTIGDIIPDTNSNNPLNALSDSDDLDKLNLFIKDKLTDEEKNILKLRFFGDGTSDGWTYEKIGELIGKQKMSVKNQIDKILNKIYQFAKSEGINFSKLKNMLIQI